MTEAQREMTLREWCGKLPDIHLANKQLEALIEALTEFRTAFANRGERTSLHVWDQRMKKANAQAASALEDVA